MPPLLCMMTTGTAHLPLPAACPRLSALSVVHLPMQLVAVHCRGQTMPGAPAPAAHQAQPHAACGPPVRQGLPPRFVTRAEVASLGLGHLVGTPLLRAYMHGFFLHQRLWQRAQALAQPLAPSALRQQRIAERLEKERASRITLTKKLPKVGSRAPGKPLHGCIVRWVASRPR